jgi:two-component system CheB/CheR fusion protein
MKDFDYKNKSFLLPILSLVLFSIITIASVISYITINLHKNYMYEQIDQAKSKYITEHKERIYNNVQLVNSSIKFQISNRENRLKKFLKDKIKVALNVTNHVYNKYKDTHNKEEMKDEIAKALSVIKFSEERSYYFMYDNKTKVIFGHPMEEFIGKNMTNYKDAKGRSLMETDAEILEKEKIGFNKIYFNKLDNQEKEFPKITCITKFEPLDLVLGTGEYLDVVEKEMKKDILAQFSQSDYNKNDSYLVILDIHNTKGGDDFATVLLNANKPELARKKFSANDKDLKGNRFRKNFLDLVMQKGEGYMKYWYKKPSTNLPASKISYFLLQKDWNWIIATGFYFEDLEKQIASMKESITTHTNNTIEKTLIWLVSLSLLSIIIAIFISIKIDKKIQKYKSNLIKTNLMLKKGQQQSHLGSWEQRSDDNSLEYSDEVYRIFEIDINKKMLFEDFINRVHPEDRDKVTSTFQQSIIDQSKYYLEHRLLFPDGRIKYVKEHAEHYYDEDGKHIRTAGTVQDVTREELSKKELAISNDKFEKAFNTTPNIIVITNLKTGKIYEVNQTFEDIMGYKREDVVGKTTLDINLWNNSDEREAYIKIFREKRIVENSVYSFKKKNGDLIIAKIYANVVTIDNEDYILAVVEDITKRLEAESQVENLFTTSNIGLAITSLEKGWVRVNEKLLDTLGYTEDELKQTTWSDITHPDDIEKDTKLFNEVVEGKRDGYEIEKRFLKKDGTYIYTILTLSVYRYDDKIKYFLASILDVSELKKLQHRFETIIQEAPNPIIVHNEDGKVLMLNKVWEKLTGYSYSEIDTIEKWTEKAYGKEKSKIKKKIDKLYELQHAVNEGEFPVITKSGETITWHFSSAPLGVIDGKRTVISSAMDITELKKKDEMMINQSRQAAMGDMIAMIAHQWRQPITVIAMVTNNINMNIALEEETTTEDLKTMADSITEQTQQLSQTIDDFRNFFKPNQEKVKATVGGVIEKTLKIIGKSLENNNIAVMIENRSETEILTYSNQLLQVFLNLLGNAKDILLDKEVSDAKITITIDETKDSIVTKICDNGGGIPKDAIKRLGEPYFTTKENNGTGLGLYMSITIVKKHLNGTLTWENKDKGACFIVTLPKE